MGSKRYELTLYPKFTGRENNGMKEKAEAGMTNHFIDRKEKQVLVLFAYLDGYLFAFVTSARFKHHFIYTRAHLLLQPFLPSTDSILKGISPSSWPQQRLRTWGRRTRWRRSPRRPGGSTALQHVRSEKWLMAYGEC